MLRSPIFNTNTPHAAYSTGDRIDLWHWSGGGKGIGRRRYNVILNGFASQPCTAAVRPSDDSRGQVSFVSADLSKADCRRLVAEAPKHLAATHVRCPVNNAGISVSPVVSFPRSSGAHHSLELELGVPHEQGCTSSDVQHRRSYHQYCLRTWPVASANRARMLPPSMAWWASRRLRS